MPSSFLWKKTSRREKSSGLSHKKRKEKEMEKGSVPSCDQSRGGENEGRIYRGVIHQYLYTTFGKQGFPPDQGRPCSRLLRRPRKKKCGGGGDSHLGKSRHKMEGKVERKKKGESPTALRTQKRTVCTLGGSGNRTDQENAPPGRRVVMEDGNQIIFFLTFQGKKGKEKRAGNAKPLVISEKVGEPEGRGRLLTPYQKRGKGGGNSRGSTGLKETKTGGSFS